MAKREVLHGGGMGNMQEMGTVVGRRGAGITTMTPGDPLMHSFNNYAKGGMQPSLSDPGMMGPMMPGMPATARRSPIGSSRRTTMLKGGI